MHPANAPVWKNMILKYIFASNPDYTYAFNKHTYIDFEISNIHGRPTVDYSDVGKALRTSKKPVVFFLGYEVGPDYYNNLFITHVVCCVSFKGKIAFMDMRNLADISKKLESTIEQELSERSGIPITLVNSACFSGTCTYLQRFRKKHTVGWCVAWALFFLHTIVNSKRPITDAYLHKLYRDLDDTLLATKTNSFIENWYVRFYQSLA